MSVLSSFLQVISLTTHWLHTWVVPQKSSSQEVVVAASGYLMQVAKEFFLPGHMNGGLVFGLIVISVP